MKSLQIDARAVGPGEPVLVIAEIGVNHDGSLQKALHLVDLAAAAGADAVKWQMFQADALLSSQAQLADYQKRAGESADAMAMLRRLQLDDAACAALARHIRARGMIPLATPFSLGDVRRIVDLRLPAIKIASPDLVNWPLLRCAAASGLPLIISCGAADMDEIIQTLQWLQEWQTPTALLHCVSSYPAPDSSLHLSWINQLRALGAPAGYSDHSDNLMAGALAVGAGACIIEKHLTWDRAAFGPDHAASADGAQFAQYVRLIRQAQAMLGSGDKRALDVENDVRRLSRQSLALRQQRVAGDVLRESDLEVRRPGLGLPPACWTQVIGKTLRRDAAAGSLLTADMLA